MLLLFIIAGVNVYLLWKTVCQFFIKLNTPSPYDIAFTFEHLSQKNKNLHSHKNLYANVHSGLIHNSPKMETIQIHTMEHYPAIKGTNTDTCKLDGSLGNYAE